MASFPTCQICRQQFSLKGPAPFLLPCLHDICETCVTEAGEGILSCSTCQRDVNLTETRLQKDVITEKEVLHLTVNHNPELVLCTHEEDGNQAVCWCKDCEDFFCENCQMVHNSFKISRKHTVQNIEDLKAGSLHQDRYCSIHPKFIADTWDEDCCMLTCATCRRTDHADHKVVYVDETADSERKEVDSLQRDVTASINTQEVHLAATIQDLSSSEQTYDMLPDKISDTYNALKTLIDQRGKEMQIELQQHREKVLEDLKTRKNTSESSLQRCQTTSDYIKKTLQYGSLHDILELRPVLEEKSQDCRRSSPSEDYKPLSLPVFNTGGLEKIKSTLAQFGNIATEIDQSEAKEAKTNEELTQELQKMTEEMWQLQLSNEKLIKQKEKAEESEKKAEKLKREMSQLQLSNEKLIKQKEKAEESKKEAEKLKWEMWQLQLSNEKLIKQKEKAEESEKEAEKLKREMSQLQLSNEKLIKQKEKAEESKKEAEKLKREMSQLQLSNEKLIKQKEKAEESKKEAEKLKREMWQLQLSNEKLIKQKEKAEESEKEAEKLKREMSQLQLSNEKLIKQKEKAEESKKEAEKLKREMSQLQLSNEKLIKQQKKAEESEKEAEKLKQELKQLRSCLDKVICQEQEAERVSGFYRLRPQSLEESFLLNCTNIQFSRSKCNAESVHINAKGELINKSEPNPQHSDQRLRKHWGTSSTVPLPLCGSPQYFEVESQVGIEKTPTVDNTLLLEIGLARVKEQDRSHCIGGQPHSYSLIVSHCPTHSSFCRKVWRHGTPLTCLSDTLENSPGTSATLHYGLVSDSARGRIAFIDVIHSQIIGKINNVDSSVALWPMFGVYYHSKGKIRMSLIVGNDIDMNNEKKALILDCLS